MSRRLLIGRHPNFSSTGIFLSQPGDDVFAPSSALLIDSRYQNIAVHAQGRIRMSRFSQDASWTVWYATATFPDLGYTPLYYGSITYVSPNGLGIPTNSNYYPASDCAVWDQTLGGADPAWGVWLENNTTMRAKVYARKGYANGDFDLYYIIFKRAL